MSDLKLYKGINNIDADLIEEADCKHKPAIHHCYALPATAAAIFIALGATGIFNTVRPQRKPDISENAVITSVPATSAAATSPAMTTDICTAITTSLTVNSTAASAQTSVSYSKQA